MSEATKPRPVPTPTSQPFWDGLAAGEVRLQHCRACGAWVYYPRSRCSSCLSAELAWEVVPGRGRVHTFTVAHQPTMPGFEDELPQIVAVVELDEGPRLTTTLVGVDPDGVAVDLEVEPVFDHGADGMTLLRYRPVR